MRLYRQLVGGAVTLSLIASGAPVLAAPPSDLRDLVGARGTSGESAMEARGYHNHHASPADAGVYTYWWNSSRKQCVRVLTADGRYADLKSVSGSDCGHNDKSDNTAAIAIGAAALIGVAALASKSHHRDDRDYDTPGTADFERGYRDGLYNETYHNYSRSNAYSDGYSAGANERGHQTSYRDRYAYAGGYGGYSGYNDIVGRANDVADDMLRSRGFAYLGKDTQNSGSGHERTYWHAANRQCISVRTSSGSVTDIHSVPKRTCR